jgi:hypothetical protein
MVLMEKVGADEDGSWKYILYVLITSKPENWNIFGVLSQDV